MSNDETPTEPERCYAAALRILAYRWNSASELRRKLERKDFSAESIDATLVRLAAEHWLDDERFAAAFVRDQQRKGHGSRRISAGLGAAGVDRDIARKVLQDNRDPQAEREALAALCGKRLRIMARRYGDEFLSSDEGRKKLSAYLLKQGYEMSLVLEVTREEIAKLVILRSDSDEGS
jgi:regulatory protein